MFLQPVRRMVSLFRCSRGLAAAAVIRPNKSEHLPSEQLALQLGLPLLSACDLLSDKAVNMTFGLQYTDGQLGLHLLTPEPTARRRKSRSSVHRRRTPSMAPLVVDLETFLANRSGSELLVKACRGRRSQIGTVWDFTAGLGRDSAVLAAAGADHVRMFERDPVVAALLQDGLMRLQQGSDRAGLSSRLQLEQTDIMDWSGGQLEKLPDVVYLDPMFAVRSKSARVKREMRLLQRWLDETGCEEQTTDEEELLELARNTAQVRTVVKRHRHAAPLGGVSPSHTVEGTTNRFDIYLKNVRH